MDNDNIYSSETKGENEELLKNESDYEEIDKSCKIIVINKIATSKLYELCLLRKTKMQHHMHHVHDAYDDLQNAHFAHL